MREILFRAKTVKLPRRWVYGSIRQGSKRLKDISVILGEVIGGKMKRGYGLLMKYRESIKNLRLCGIKRQKN